MNTSALKLIVSLQISTTEYVPFNKPSHLWFLLSQQSMRGNKFGKSGQLSIVTSLMHLMMLLNHIRDFIFPKTLVERTMQLRFLKWMPWYNL